MFARCIDWWGWDVITTTPNKDLVLTILINRLLLVKALECTIMTFCLRVVLFHFVDEKEKISEFQ